MYMYLHIYIYINIYIEIYIYIYIYNIYIIYIYNYQVGEMKGIEIRLLFMGRIMIPIRLCFLPIHSSGICMLGPNE